MWNGISHLETRKASVVMIFPLCNQMPVDISLSIQTLHPLLESKHMSTHFHKILN